LRKRISSKDLSYRLFKSAKSIRIAEKIDQQQFITQNNSVPKRERAADNRDTIETATLKSKKEKRQLISQKTIV
jgi:hypothetical protein